MAQYTASSSRNAQLSQLDLVLHFLSYFYYLSNIHQNTSGLPWVMIAWAQWSWDRRTQERMCSVWPRTSHPGDYLLIMFLWPRTSPQASPPPPPRPPWSATRWTALRTTAGRRRPARPPPSFRRFKEETEDQAMVGFSFLPSHCLTAHHQVIQDQARDCWTLLQATTSISRILSRRSTLQTAIDHQSDKLII